MPFANASSEKKSAASKPAAADTKSAIDFNRDIRPIFSDACYACHGPDEAKRKGKLRLDRKDDAFKETKSGGFAIVSGDIEKSLIVKRILSTDADEVMPPPDSGKKLSPEQIDRLRRWIAQGAKWDGHWSYTPPRRPPQPEVKAKAWSRNAIDRFILTRLEKEGLHPSSEADKATLIRRLSLDLLGLPPTIAEVDAFLAEKSSDAYEKLVDRLLASPHFGERMAQGWLDLARYADTNGYHIDNHRDMWLWREWVINAFNQNKRFDEFTIEQLAGDLLPNATLDQRIASGFCRNVMVNFEGGADPDEYLSKYVIDRVDTVSTAWLGTTMACAECHDHKYDPFTTKDFYRLYAYFNTIAEKGLDGNYDNPEPSIKVPSREQAVQLLELTKAIPAAENRVKEREGQLPEAQASWEKEVLAKLTKPVEPDGLLANFTLDETPAGIDALGARRDATWIGTNAPVWVDGKLGKALKFDGGGNFIDAGNAVEFERTNAFSFGCWAKLDAKGGVLFAKMDEAPSLRGFDLEAVDKKIRVHLINAWPDNALEAETKETVATNTWLHLFVTHDGTGKAEGIKIFVNGKSKEIEKRTDKLTESIAPKSPLRIGKRNSALPFNGVIDDVRFYNRALAAGEIEHLASIANLAIVPIAADKRTDEQKAELKKYFRDNHAFDLKKADEKLAKLRKSKDDLMKEIPGAMVMKEMDEPRPTHILVRGDFRNKGERVTPDVPKSLPQLPDGAPTNRLALARWLVSRENPLPSRVTVNRYWQLFFGTGLVKTANDFGSQGEWPSHPELLDWLATEFMDRDWDIKAMLKLMVTSATYRQSSKVDTKTLEADPYNRLYARGPRFRLDAELVRDSALAVSGLLNRKVGGPSVRPFQPPGLWEQLAIGGDFSSQSYSMSKGDDLYRRGLYVYWKRSVPYPSMTTFDSPNRETCTVQRPRTTTPLQALVLMNDPAYLDAARALAQRVLKESDGDAAKKLTYAFRLTLAREPKKNELQTLLKVYQQQLKNFQDDQEAAKSLVNVGDSKQPGDANDSELAAWTAVGSVLLNLDETITKG
ncbi:MAG: DUF1553 domain-containing protein [Verrucomicrobia bacterium]|nr:DUF1553 domain-containing protein [Verrucomicrobiota bacterium]